MTATDKAAMRAAIRSRYAGEAARMEQSRLICCRILASEAYRSARVIAGYVPMKREADIMPVLLDILAQGKVFALPLCGKAPEMTLRRVVAMEELVPGAYGIPAPSVHAPIIDVESVDLMLVPLEGIDHEGYRLGKGGGYYDHLLGDRKTLTMGCALSWQLVDMVQRQPWDVPLCMCAAPESIYQYRAYKANLERNDDDESEEKQAED